MGSMRRGTLTTAIRRVKGAGTALSCLLATAAVAQTLAVQPGRARPGDAILVTVKDVASAPQGTLGARTLKFQPLPRGGYQAVTGLPVETPPGELPLKVQLGDGEEESSGAVVLEGMVEVVAPNFPERELKVAGKYIEPPAKVKRWMKEDRVAFAKAFAQPSVPRVFRSPFGWPRQARFTAPFGDRRVFNGKLQSQHYGLDIDGRPGDPVYAANDGTVVMARSCYAAGNTVLLHHGADLYSAYFHLSKILVPVGKKVKRGQKIGLVGGTGRVTGPHLHFGVKIDGVWVDPESVLRLEFE